MFFAYLAHALFTADENGNLSPLISSSPEISALPPQGDYGLVLVKMFLTMIAIVALFALSYWFLRRLIRGRLQKGADEQTIQILEKRMISPKTMLYLVEVDEKKILIAESQLEIRKIETLPSHFDLKNE